MKLDHPAPPSYRARVRVSLDDDHAAPSIPGMRHNDLQQRLFPLRALQSMHMSAKTFLILTLLAASLAGCRSSRETVTGLQADPTAALTLSSINPTIPTAAALKKDPEGFQAAMELEERGRYKAAYKSYLRLAKRHRKTDISGEALFHAGRCLEEFNRFNKAFDTYQKVVDQFPRSPRFPEIIRRQYNIGMRFFQGDLKPMLGLRHADSLAEAITRLEAVVQNAPFSAVAPEAQFHVALAHEQLGDFSKAAEAYRKIPADYPDHPLVERAKFRRAECLFQIATIRTYNQEYYQDSLDQYMDFLTQFPESPLAPEAYLQIENLRSRQADEMLRIAKFYLKQKQVDSAKVYLRNIIRDYTDTESASEASGILENLES
jgi:outer membrane assembly lipoprotein YfiO